MTENRIFLNPNQLIEIRKLQNKLCAVLNSRNILTYPALPASIKVFTTLDLNAKITKAIPLSIESNPESIFLKVYMEINGIKSEGWLTLVFLENTRILSEKITDKACLESLFSELSVKQFSPIRIVELNMTRHKNGNTWNITKEKWVKIK